MNWRALTEAVLTMRSRLANIAGKTFGNKRDIYVALGYKRELTPADYRSRYRRNGVANRIVKAFPSATWRGGADIIEDKDPDKITAFEQAFIDLDRRLKLWDKMKRADTLAGIGRYAVLLIGAPGELDQPLVKAKPEEIMYFTPFAEEDATIQSYVGDITNARFGLPEYYSLKRTSITNGTVPTGTPGIGKKCHWSRVIHISDGLLDDNIFGEPRLEAVWNLLDDLEKVSGGGAEAFWMRANQGLQLDLDPTLNVTPEQKEALRVQLEEYEHELRRTLLTRGVEIEKLGSDVADFKSPVEALMSLISAGTGIPQRVLMGSEQGKLAARQDRANWDNRVMDRQKDLAGPMMVRPLVDRLIELGAVPTPANDYEVRFSSITTMDDEQRAETAKNWASLNQTAGETVVTVNEIRERVLDLPPLQDVLSDTPGSERIIGQGQGGQPQVDNADGTSTGGAPVVAKKGGASWKHVHQAADTFRTKAKARRLASLRKGPQGDGREETTGGAEATR